MSIMTGPPGRRPELEMETVQGPLLVLWGSKVWVWTAAAQPAFTVCCLPLAVAMTAPHLVGRVRVPEYGASAQDPCTPVDGPIGQWFTKLPQSRPNTEFHLLPGVDPTG